MAGYAAMARISPVAPHRVSHDALVEPTDRARATTVEIDSPAMEDVSGQPFLASVSYAWDDVREIWRQSMDVLRDPRIY
jgi:hypothetical protein